MTDWREALHRRVVERMGTADTTEDCMLPGGCNSPVLAECAAEGLDPCPCRCHALVAVVVTEARRERVAAARARREAAAARRRGPPPTAAQYAAAVAAAAVTVPLVLAGLELYDRLTRDDER